MRADRAPSRGEPLATGLFDRAVAVFELIDRVRHVGSDAAADGLLRLLPPGVRGNVAALLDAEVREAALPFMQMIKRWLFAARAARADGKKLILVPFNFPPELVLAFEGAVPLTTEVMTTLAAICLEGGGQRYFDLAMSLGLPDHICSSNTVEIGSVLAGGDLTPDAIISAAPGACDANAKIHEFLSHYCGIPQLVLDKPVDDTAEGRRLYGAYFRQLVARLEALVGEPLQEGRLRRLLAGANRCAELYWELYELRKLRPSPVPNLFSLLLTGTRFCSWGTEPAIELLETMVRVARRRVGGGAARPERLRALWAYTSYYFDLDQLQGWMGRQGYTFLADVLDLCMPQPIDLGSRESMIEGMAAAAWTYPMNRQMGSASMSRAWVEDVVHVCRELSADCAIYCGHDACKQTWSVVSILREELARRAKIPLLVLHGDSWLEATTPITAIQAELEEFFANVVLPRRAGVRRPVRRRRRR